MFAEDVAKLVSALIAFKSVLEKVIEMVVERVMEAVPPISVYVGPTAGRASCKVKYDGLIVAGSITLLKVSDITPLFIFNEKPKRTGLLPSFT